MGGFGGGFGGPGFAQGQGRQLFVGNVRLPSHVMSQCKLLTSPFSFLRSRCFSFRSKLPGKTLRISSDLPELSSELMFKSVRTDDLAEEVPSFTRPFRTLRTPLVRLRRLPSLFKLDG
jgi:hypothetical protein